MIEVFLTPDEVDERAAAWKAAIAKGCFSCQAGSGVWDVPAVVVCTGCGYGYCQKCSERGCYLCLEEAE